MFRFVYADAATSGKGEGGNLSPTLFVHVRDSHVLRFEVRQGRCKVVAHEEKLVPVVRLGIVEC